MIKSLSVGSSIFVASSYILVVAPELLGDIGVPKEAAFIGCLLSIGGSWMLSGWMTKTPLILAPAIGLLAFTREFYLAANKDPAISIGPYDLLAVSCGTGLILLLASKGRQRLLDAIPEPIRLGINGAVGALLAKTALEYLATPQSTASAVGSGVGAVALGALYVARGRFARGTRANPSALKMGLVNSYYLASFAAAYLAFLLVDWVGPGSSGQAGIAWFAADDIWIADNLLSQAWRDVSLAEGFLLLAYGFVTLFVLLTDIPGTPYALLDSDSEGSEERKRARDKSVEGSFLANGWAAIVYPWLGMTPPIYYSENYLVRDVEHLPTFTHEDVWSGIPAIAMGAICVAAGLLLAGLQQFGILTHLPLLLPELVAPILLFLSLVIIADGMISKMETTQSPIGAAASQQTALPTRTFHFYMPAAAAIITTPRLGLSFGLCAAFIAYFLAKSSLEPELQRDEKGEFWIVILFAAGAALVDIFVAFLAP